jgi:hypothetical protein
MLNILEFPIKQRGDILSQGKYLIPLKSYRATLQATDEE